MGTFPPAAAVPLSQLLNSFAACLKCRSSDSHAFYRPTTPKLLLPLLGSGPHLIQGSFGQQSQPPNGISIGSTVFAGLTNDYPNDIVESATASPVLDAYVCRLKAYMYVREKSTPMLLNGV